MITTPKEFIPILGKKPWRVWKGIGSFLLFEFGPRQKDETEHGHGSHTIWIYMADWRIRHGKIELANSENNDVQIGKAAVALTGKKLESIVLDTVVVPRRVRYGARLFFEDQLRLDVFMYERTKRESVFMFYTPQTVISYDNDGLLRSKPLKLPRAKQSSTINDLRR